MKRLMIFVLAGMLLVFGASAVFANPQADNNDGSGSPNLSNNTTEAGGSTGSTTTGIGDVAVGGSTQSITETKTFDNSDASQDNDTKTATGNSLLSNNTKSETETKTESEAEKNIAGAQAAGGSNATNTNDVDLLSGNTKTTSVTKNETETKTVGDVLSGNTKTTTIDKSGQIDKHNNANENYGSAVAQDGSTSTNTYTKTANTDKSGSNYLGKAEAEKNIAGSQNAGIGNSASTTNELLSNNTKDSNNSKTYTKTYNKQEIDDTKYGSAAANNGNASATNTKTTTVTIDKSGQNNSKTFYAVDNQVMDACITGFGDVNPDCCPTPEITQTMTKTFSASTNNSFGGFTGIANNATAAGNFNTTTAYTSISVGGNVNPGP